MSDRKVLRIPRNPVVRANMDATGERFFLIVRQPVERVERDPEQAFRAQAPVRAVAVPLVEQLHHEAAHARSAFRRIGGRLWRRGCQSSWRESHQEILTSPQKNKKNRGQNIRRVDSLNLPLTLSA